MKSKCDRMPGVILVLLAGLVQSQTNQPPVVSINGGNRAFVDTDNVIGEVVNAVGTATDSDGTIVKTAWTVNGVEVATSNNAALPLRDGWNDVTFTATDNSGAESTRKVSFQVSGPSFALPRLEGLSTEQQTSETEFSVAIRNSTSALVSNASRAQTLTLNAYIFPASDDISQTVDIFVVAKTPMGWFMRNVDGNFVPWNERVVDLVPASEDQRLNELIRVPIHAGKLSVVGDYKLFVGYRRVDGTELVYSDKGADFKITH